MKDGMYSFRSFFGALEEVDVDAESPSFLVGGGGGIMGGYRLSQHTILQVVGLKMVLNISPRFLYIN